MEDLFDIRTVIELSGVLGVQPPSSFFTPQLILKNYLGGVRLNPPEQRSVTQCILLYACIQRLPTRLSFRMIRSSEATTVLWIIYLFTSIDVKLANVLFLYTYAIYTAMYICVCTVDNPRSKAQKRPNAI